MKIRLANQTNIYYADHGSKSAPPVLMIMGLGAQLSMWPKSLIDKLLAQGFRVICFDNRDTGLSQKFTSKQCPNAVAQSMLKNVGVKLNAPYTLVDMAEDASELLTSLGVKHSHVIGVSMGGMIAQILAANFPAKVKSLTLISSTTNNPKLPSSDFRLLLALARRKKVFPTRIQAINQALHTLNEIGTKGEDPWSNGLRERIEESYDRCYYPVGASRHLAAIIATGDLRRWSRSVVCPTLIVHGTADPLVPFTGGKDLIRNIPNSELLSIQGMGHDLPDKHIERIVNAFTYRAGLHQVDLSA